ncbi:ImmA/IrrE family metallo-endopeptidase [Lysinibacillus sphaericus]|nr:ImmA/IrrE family metallo-endopeptidase [Lysinibacillus sphaericus]
MNERLTKQQLWQDFCHELCHLLMHNGQQRRMSRLCRDYQENEANNFMLHACMTTFMLDQLELSPGDI